MKKTFLMLTTAILLLCMLQGGVGAQQNALSPTRPATPATPATPNGPGTPATPATPARPAIPGTPIPRDAHDMKDRVKQELGQKGRGSSMANPFLPSQTIRLGEGRILFVINVVIDNIFNFKWIDPVAAVGYDYSVEKGPKVTAVELPAGIGDNVFDLWVYNEQASNYMDSGVDIEGGNQYTFNEPVKKFAIRGIEVSAGVDAENETAFPTGLRFEKTGKAIVHMTSIPAANAKN